MDFGDSLPALTMDLILILFQMKEGSPRKKEELMELIEKCGDGLYRDVVYFLTRNYVENPKTAKKLSLEIIAHHKRITKLLGRDSGVEVAAIDYMRNIKKWNSGKNDINKMDDPGRSGKKQNYDKGRLQIDIETEIQRSDRHDSKFSIIILDIDNFKKINLSYGHNTGDDALIFIVKVLKQNIRKSDRIYRFGGDEFVILLTEADLDNSLKVGQNIKKVIAETKVPGVEGYLSISMGISVFGSHGTFDYASLLKSAGAAIDKARQTKNGSIALFKGDEIDLCQEEFITDTVKPLNTADERKFKVQSITHGLSMGKIYKYRDVLSYKLHEYEILPERADEEVCRVKKAIEAVRDDLLKMRDTVDKELGKNKGAIFTVHHLILDDKKLFNEIESELRNRLINGEIIIRDVFKRWENKFKAHEDDIFKDKARDIADLGRRVLKKLKGIDTNLLGHIKPDSILLSKRLLPSDTIHLKRKNIKAIITEEGSRTCHSAILARALDIPYILLEKSFKKIPNNAQVIVNADEEYVIIKPSKSQKAIFKKKLDVYNKKHNQYAGHIPASVSFKGRRILIGSNVSSIDEVQMAKQYKADNIGLLRIENIYMETAKMPGEEYLTAHLLDILKPAKDMEIMIRLLDIGADKSLPYINLTDDYNPALGLRGIRLLFEYPNLLETQLKSCIRLKEQFNIKLLIPMVSLAEDVLKVKAALGAIKKDHNILVGAMIETPAAVFGLDEIIKASDFISVGTNDLIQYTMAADREKDNISYYFEQGNEVILPVLQQIIEHSEKFNKSCCICGEIAGEMTYLKEMLAMGLTSISISPSLIPLIKNEIAGLEAGDSDKS